MRVLPISVNSRINKNITNAKTTNPLSADNKYTYPNKLFNVYLGKDLVSFKSKSFEHTLQNNYFHLPQGATPDAFQIEAGKALNEGKNVIVEAPTGTGKTAVAYYAASKNMEEGKTTFYTTPLKALSNQKLNELKAIYGNDKVGILTGDRRENVDAPILVMTTEVYRNMALSRLYGEDTPLMDNLGTVILDECHYLGDISRGSTWEESIMMTPDNVQILALSATIGNPKEIKNWVQDISKKNVHLVSIPSSERHVPLEFDSIYTNSYKSEEKRIQKQLKKNGYSSQESSEAIFAKPTLSDFKYAVDKLSKKDQLPAIFFLFSRKFSRELLEYLNSEGPVLTTKKEQEETEKIIEKYKSEKYLGMDLDTEALKKGYAVHNAGIIPSQKELIEELFQKKLVKVVIATETLAAGINMPAKTVVISSPYKPVNNDENEEGQRLLTSNEFKQMAGRAGRRGIDTVGYVYTMPVDRNSEQEFLMMEAIDCNSLLSHYSPEYSFLTGYYEHNPISEGLREIYSKSFYVQGSDETDKEERIQQLTDISNAKSRVLEARKFINTYGDKIEVTPSGKMVSKVRGYDALTLVEAIESKKFDNITPESLAMIAGAMANPANSNEFAIGLETDLSYMFEALDDNVQTVFKSLLSDVNENLKKLGKSVDSFGSYDEMLKFAKAIKKPDNSEEEVRVELEKMQKLRAKMYKMTKLTGKYSLEELTTAVKKGDTIPTRVLEYYYQQLQSYKTRINAKDIETYIEKLNNDLSQFDTTSKGNKAKARIERKTAEIKKDIQYAESMKLLDENLERLIAENHDFLKKNPPQKIKQDFYDVQEKYARLTSKDTLISQIQGLKDIEKYIHENDIRYENKINNSKSKECINEIIKKSLEIFEAETENGLKAKTESLGKSAAETLYIWAYLNGINSETMSNWRQLLRIIPESDADEGTIYRRILQSADLLSQIKDIADAGYENAVSYEDKEYYKKLRTTAKEARELIIKNPVTV